MADVSLGQAAYEAYCEATPEEGPFVRWATMPAAWRAAWEAAAAAAVEACGGSHD